MSTVLAAGTAVLIRMLTFALVAFLILALISVGAMAQDAVAVTPTGPAPVDDNSWAASIALIRDSLIATILAVIAGVISWASSFAPAWLRAIIDKLTTSEAIEWDDHVRLALGNAFDIAAAKVGVTPENLESLEQKADFMGWAVGALRKYNKEIVSFADKDQNGIVDLVEIELAKRGANPKLFQMVDEPFPLDPKATASPQEAMGFMAGAAAPSRRVVKKTAEQQMAATFAPRKRGTVVQ